MTDQLTHLQETGALPPHVDPAKSRVRYLLLFFSFAGLASLHVYVKARGPQYSGALLALDHLFDVALIVLLFALFAGLGRRFLAAVGLKIPSPLEELVFSVGIGSGVLSIFTLLLGATFGFSLTTITLLLALCLVFVSRQIRKLPDAVGLAVADLTANTGIVPRAILGIVALFMISQALLPPTNWDSLMYHLRLPAQLLHAGRLFLPEDNLHMAYVQLAHMLYLPPLAFGSLSGPALVSVFFALLLGLAVFAFARRFFDSQTAAFSIQLLWSSTIVLLVAITPRIDVTLALFLFLAHFALLLARANWKFFYLSAALLGFAIGVKYTGVAYALALTPVILWIAFSRQTNIAARLLSLCYFAMIALGVSLPWIAKNWWLFEAPFYPLFVRRMVDPWLAFLYAEKVLPESIAPNILTMLGEVRLPFNLFDLFVDPGVLTIEAEAAFYRFSPVFLVLILWLVGYTKNAVLNGLIIPPIGYVIALIFFSSQTNLRYLIPVIALFTLASVYMLVSRVMGGQGSRIKSIIAYGFVLLALVPTIKMMNIWSTNGLALRYFIGKASAQDYLQYTEFPPDYAGFAPTVAYVNQNLPPTSRILMLFEARGFHFNVPVIQDNVLTNWPLLAERASKLDCLAGGGITHVLVNVASVHSYLERGLDPATVRWDVFRKFADECLVPVFQGPGHILYEVQR